MPEISASVLPKLKQFDTATICNVIELFELRPRNRGFMLREITAAFPNMPPMVGFASTVTCRTFVAPVSKAEAASVPDVIIRFDELSGPPVIVIQNLDSGGSAAMFGDVMCNSFMAFGATGLVTNGPGRDLDQVAQIEFPVFHRGIVAAHGYNHMLDIHLPIQVGGISIAPDDLLHGDGNGVTTDSQSDRVGCGGCLCRICGGRASHHQCGTERFTEPGRLARCLSRKSATCFRTRKACAQIADRSKSIDCAS